MSADDETTPSPDEHDTPAPATADAPPAPPVPSVPPVPPLPPQAGAAGIAPPPAPSAPRPRPAWLTPRTLGFAALGGAIGVGAAVVAAIVVLLLTLLLGVVSGGLDVKPGGVDLDPSSTSPLSLIVWIATLGLFGAVSGSAAGTVIITSFSVSFTAAVVPAVVFVTAFLTAAWWAYRQERATPTAGRGGSWALAAVAGAATGILTLLLAVIGRTTADASGAGAVEISTLAPASFFGPFVAIALASVFGRWLARGVPARLFGGALWQAPTRFRWGTRDLYDYAVVLAGLFVPASLIAVFALGDGAAAAWPAGVGLITALAIAVGHFGAVTVGFTSPIGTGSMSEAFGLLSPNVTPWAWLLLLLAVVAALGAAIAIAARRTAAPVPLARAWALPVLTAVAALAVGLAFGTAYAAGNVGSNGVAVAFSAGVGPAWWNVAIAAIWGAAVEALARFVAPSVIAAWPALARVSLSGRTAAAPLAAPPAAGSPVGADTASATPQTAAAPAAPLSPTAKRNLLIGGIVAGAVVLLAIGGAVTIGILKSTVFSPERAAEAYVDDIAKGRFASAFERTPGDTTGATALVSSNDVTLDAAITNVKLGSPTTGGGAAQIPVSYEVDGQRDSGVVTLTSSGTQFLFFDQWRVTGGLESRATIAGAPLKIGGVEVDPGEGGASLIAYPGIYPVDADLSKWETADVEPLRVTSAGAQLYAQPEPSAALVDEVQRQVDAQLDTCAASTELRPDGCPFSAYAWGDTKDVAWKITTYPKVDVRSTDSFSAYDGRATVTYQRKDWNDKWAKDESESFVAIYSGKITIDGDDVTVALQ